MDETYPAPAAGELSGEGEGASPEDQAALIERIKLGDVELFLKLIQPHGKTLHAVCHSILQNDADAEEVAQETLLKADRKSTRLNSSHRCISYAVFCLKKKSSSRGASYSR